MHRWISWTQTAIIFIICVASKDMQGGAQSIRDKTKDPSILATPPTRAVTQKRDPLDLVTEQSLWMTQSGDQSQQHFDRWEHLHMTNAMVRCDHANYLCPEQDLSIQVYRNLVLVLQERICLISRTSKVPWIQFSKIHLSRWWASEQGRDAGMPQSFWNVI